MAKAAAKKRPTRRKSAARSSRGGAGGRRRWLVGLAAVVLVSVAVHSWWLAGYTIPSRSMEDTLLYGDSVLVAKWDTETPEPGDLVVFRSPEDPGRTFVKRCVAVAGQRVELRDKVVYVDGERLPDPRFSKYLDARILPAARGGRDNLPARLVPAGHLFVMGDNRDNSRDSRHWGFLSTDAIVGRPLFVYFSAAPAAAEAGFGERLSSLAERVRWSRLGSAVE